MQVQQATSSISQSQQGFVVQEQKKAEEKFVLEPPAKKKEDKEVDKVDISNEAKNALKQELTDEEKKIVAELKRIDQEVKAHEQAHKAAGGQYATGGASYQYQQGPDNNRYAVAGEVSIDTSPVSGDPTATKLKMQQVRRAALAPANPSAQDLRVAAQASQAALQAAAEEVELRKQEMQESEAQAPGKTETAQTNKEESSSFLSNYAANSYKKSAETSQSSQLEIQNKSLSIFA